MKFFHEMTVEEMVAYRKSGRPSYALRCSVLRPGGAATEHDCEAPTMEQCHALARELGKVGRVTMHPHFWEASNKLADKWHAEREAVV